MRALVLLSLLAAQAAAQTPACDFFNNNEGYVDIGSDSFKACSARDDCFLGFKVIQGDIAVTVCRDRRCADYSDASSCAASKILKCEFNADGKVCIPAGGEVPCSSLADAPTCKKYLHCSGFSRVLADGTSIFVCQAKNSPPPCDRASTKKNCGSIPGCYWRANSGLFAEGAVCTADPSVVACSPRGSSSCRDVGCQLAPKCPDATGLGTCVELCKGDAQTSNCPLGMGCCSNGCGHTCTEVKTVCDVPPLTCADIKCPKGTACDPSSSPARCRKCIGYSFCGNPRCGTAKEYQDYVAFPPMCPQPISDIVASPFRCTEEPAADGTCSFVCGGLLGDACPSGLACVDIPKDGCDPQNGGADCLGLCAQCPGGKVHTDCGSACPPTCANPAPQICTKQCVAGCFCPQGTFENADGNCVEECPPAPCAESKVCTDRRGSTCCADNEVCVFDEFKFATCTKSNKCCDPSKEPGKFGNPIPKEGYVCCPTTGEWVGNIGDGQTWSCPGLPNGPFGEKCVCCDPLKEPGTNGNPPSREGHACCPLTGEWVLSIGDGKTFGNCPGYETGPFGNKCPNICCDPLKEPGKFGNPPSREGYVCCPTTGEWALSFGDATNFACPGRQTGPFGVACPTCQTEKATYASYAKQCVKANPTAQMCGGIAGLLCPKGQVCLDDPRDTCNPEKGGADCSGVCCATPGPRGVVPTKQCLAATPLQICGGIAGIQCQDNSQCVDDPRDGCDPTKGGADCSGICCCEGNFCPAPEANCNKKCSASLKYWYGKYTKDANLCDRACVCEPCPLVTQATCNTKCAENKLKPVGKLVDTVINGVTCKKCTCVAGVITAVQCA